MKKRVSVTGTNGTFEGVIFVRSRTVMRLVHNPHANVDELKEVVVYDVDTRIDNKVFGETVRGIHSSLGAEVECACQEASLLSYLKSIAHICDHRTFEERMKERGYF